MCPRFPSPPGSTAPDKPMIPKFTRRNSISICFGSGLVLVCGHWLTVLSPHVNRRKEALENSLQHRRKLEASLLADGAASDLDTAEKLQAAGTNRLDNQRAKAKALEDYLNKVLQLESCRRHHELWFFLEVSHLSFLCRLGSKGKEGFVAKRAGERYRNGQFRLLRCVFIGLDFVLPLWRKRWIVVKETWLLDVNPRTGNIGVVMLMDTAFSVQLGERDRGRASHTVYISNSNRVMAIRSWSRRRALEWYNHLRLVAESDGEILHAPPPSAPSFHRPSSPVTALPFTSPNPFGSFAPVRPHVLARAFVDGEDYMAAAWQALSCATEEIFIAGWFLSPEVLLKRCDAAENCPPEWRLMNLLQNKAVSGPRHQTDGIRVFVLLYHELALSLNSAYTARILTGLHPLIKVGEPAETQFP
ncbi:unnamed protein product [Cyprideis torosa]|uniref:Uncharacterized protein n=1 Tax=Cyprideis torosa TaxID=163714 RepID=A0A7R8W1F5_9CRUS|nr:unnamed protein product [Cyprideis torosa]CAG0879738.1 unnamed protein product [Cyprideis torosa]